MREEAAVVPTIRVDDDVYHRLQQEAKPFVDTPNSVLRRLLDLDGPAPKASDVDRARGAGELMTLLRAGLLRPGEGLEWRRRGSVYRAVVTKEGRLLLEDGQIFDTPSGAARFLAGYEVNGWRTWARAGDGLRLAVLRDQL
ncbi:hypothetical protein K1W54_28295 [Micromonospora sp. CPCC 205371]|nr:hypothetical protein [Micromonospora sp. CPCC 205371]